VQGLLRAMQQGTLSIGMDLIGSTWESEPKVRSWRLCRDYQHGQTNKKLWQ
jgi:hypothetical protein